MAYSFIDLFAGAGGFSLGLVQTGAFRSLLAIEHDTVAARTYCHNFGHRMVMGSEGALDGEQTVFAGDIRMIDRVTVKADLIVGGPPCQGLVNLGRMSAGQQRMEQHRQLNELWHEYFRIVHQVRPLAFVLENARDLAGSKGRLAIEHVAKLLGYTTRTVVLDAANYGVPQHRHRTFIMGLLGDIGPSFPGPTGTNATVAAAIGDLPLHPTTAQPYLMENGIQDLHIARNPTALSLARYKVVQPGEGRHAIMARAPELASPGWLRKPNGTTDVLGRLRWDEPSVTIRTEFYKPEKGRYLHPSSHRPITHREAARLQTFPDKFFFYGNKVDIARQIGNAVPPLLAKSIAEHVLRLLPPVSEQLARGWVIPVVEFEPCLQEALRRADILSDSTPEQLNIFDHFPWRDLDDTQE